MVNQKFKYFAFISYSGKDEKWAKWLHINLEHYHIPATLCKENPNIPKKIRPVFWYKKDLSGTKLKEALEKELEVSQYLIVICSPDSAKSDWVNDEVKSFIARRRSKYIIPFIVDGVPHSANKNNECFPESLRNLPREEEIRGISVQEDGKQHALVDVVATMFGVSFDTLWQRHKRRERNIRNLWISICTFMMVCAFGIWDYTRTKVEYYADWVDCNGIAQGIIPLDDEQVNHRYYSYKFESSRVPFGEKGFYSWRLKRVSIVNSKGVISNYIPDNHDFFYPIQEYLYTDGYVTEIINRDNYNRVVMQYSISDDYNNHTACLYDLAGKDVRQESSYLSASTTAMNFGNNIDNKSKIKRFHYTRNEQGYITKVTYHANDDDKLEVSAIGDNNNIYGKIYELDSLGRIIKMSYINNEGNLMTDKFGVGHIKFNYASFGSEETTEYLGNDEKLAYNEQKYARMISKLDIFGNPIEQWHEGIDGEPCFNYKNIYRQIITFDDNGFLIEMKYLDFDGNLAYCADNYAIQRGKYDSKGRAIECSLFDVNDKPCYTKDNFSICKMKYNSNNCLVDISRYDIDGNPCVNKEEMVHCVQVNYDEYNYPIEYSYLGIDGEPAKSPSYGYAKETLSYNDYHQLIFRKVYDENEQPCICKSNYTCESKYHYDSRGNLIKIEYFDDQGKPCLSKNGYASIEYKYDNFGNCINEKYLGIDDKPMFLNMVASKTYKYTPNGLLKEERCYDVNGNLCLNNNWYAIGKYEYDNNGNQIKQSFYNIDSLSCYIKDKCYSVLESKYDNCNVVEERFFDVDGNLVYNNNHYAIGRYDYDEFRNIISYSYFSPNNEPCYTSDGVHKYVKKYDKRRNVISTATYDVQGNLCNSKNKYAFVRNSYDIKGNLISVEFYDNTKKRVNTVENISKKIFIYDELGREIKHCYLDKDNNLCWGENIHDGGANFYSQVEYEYDIRGNIIKYSYYGPNGKPTMVNGHAARRLSYDDYSRIIECQYLDCNGEAANGGQFKKAIEKYEYQQNHTANIIKLFNTDSSHYITIKLILDNKNNVVEREFLDSNNKLKKIFIPGFSDTECAKECAEFDVWGLNTQLEYYDENNEKIDYVDGYSSIVNSYNAHRMIESQELFNKMGKPICSKVQGWHKRLYKYDECGRISEISYFNEKDQYVNVNSSYLGGGCKIVYTYDIFGNVKSSLYRAHNGEAILDVPVENIPKEIESTGSAIMMRVEFPGQFKDRGLYGAYFILQWNGWTIYDDIVKFSEEFTKSKELDKHIVFVPWIEIDGNWQFGEIIDTTFTNQPLGVRIIDYGQDKSIAELYQVWKQKE